jgi:hypothetical protein
MIDKQSERKRIRNLELARLEQHNLKGRKMLEAYKSGRSEKQFLDHSGMKRRYLEALAAYRNFGLTPSELCDKTRYLTWLCSPGEEPPHPRLKTISMFLRRLANAGLVSREKDGREYRYFLAISGVKRLSYYYGIVL